MTTCAAVVMIVVVVMVVLVAVVVAVVVVIVVFVITPHVIDHVVLPYVTNVATGAAVIIIVAFVAAGAVAATDRAPFEFDKSRTVKVHCCYRSCTDGHLVSVVAYADPQIGRRDPLQGTKDPRV